MDAAWTTGTALVLLALDAVAVMLIARRRRGLLLRAAPAAVVWLALILVGALAGVVVAVSAALVYAGLGIALALAAALAVPPRARGARAAIVAGLWTLLVPVPLAALSFDPAIVYDAAGLVPLDYGAALAIAVPWLGPLAARVASGTRLSGDRHGPPALRLALATAFVWLVALAWLAGIELHLDSDTSRVLTTAVLAPIASAAGWLVVERLRLARTTPGAAASGVVAGVAAALPAGASLDPLWSIILGAVAGCSSALIGYSARAAAWHWGSLRHVLALTSIPAAIGVVFLGLFASEYGLVYTGSVDLVESQFVAVAASALWSGAGTAVAFLPLIGTRA